MQKPQSPLLLPAERGVATPQRTTHLLSTAPFLGRAAKTLSPPTRSLGVLERSGKQRFRFFFVSRIQRSDQPIKLSTTKEPTDLEVRIAPLLPKKKDNSNISIEGDSAGKPTESPVSDGWTEAGRESPTEMATQAVDTGRQGWHNGLVRGLPARTGRRPAWKPWTQGR